MVYECEIPTPVPDRSVVSEANLEDMLKSMKDGRKIDAIKACRYMTNLGLIEAKGLVERYNVS